MPVCRAARLSALLIALALLAGTPGGASAQAAAEGPSRADAPAGAPAWARGLAQLRRTVAAAERASGPAAADSAAAALALAQSLEDEPGFALQGDARALGLRAQAVFEAHAGGTRPPALSPAEFAALRGPSLAGLTPHGLPAVEASTPASAPAARAVKARAATPAHLAYPPEAAGLVAEQTALVARVFRGNARRARAYYPLIERTLRRHRLPPELKFVALIESGLDPLAVSSAGAEGLWQFMPATASDFGLDSLGVRDPARATDAAARFLTRLHRRFRGDWQLALAAYNAGPGRVGQIVTAYQRREGRYPSYWDIHSSLPLETQLYVPRFIGAAATFG